jgi:Ca-activated chloride channel family protein
MLTDLTIDWGGLAVTDVYPARIPDLFAAKPVVVTGRYAGSMRGTVRLCGKVGGGDVARAITLDLPAAEPRHDVLATLWARARIEDLMGQDYAGAQRGAMRADLRQQVTQLGLDYKLATQFTSFVAVEELVVTAGGKPRRVEVPVNLPEGMSHKGMPAAVYGGVAGGTPGGVLGGIIGSVPSAAPPPPPPPMPAAGLMLPRQMARIVDPSGSPASLGKLDPALATLAKGADRTTKVDVQVLLRDASAATMAQLQQLGFEVVRPAGRDLMLIGRIAAGRLAELSAVGAVRYVVKRGR